MRLARILLVGIFFHILVAIIVPLSDGAEVAEFDGLIEPYLVVEIGSGVVGILDSVTVDRDDMVKEGQILATLQSGVEQAAMELAQARADMEATIQAKKAALEFAKRDQQRLMDLFSENAVPFQEWDEVETKRVLSKLELAEAIENKRLAKLELERAIEVVKQKTILSPITGVVVERYLYKGEYVENQPILKLAQIDPLNVEVIMPVDMLGSVRVGMRATVKPEAPVSGVYTAKVTIVDRVVDAASSTFGVRLELPNPDYHLSPGLKCKVIFLDE